MVVHLLSAPTCCLEEESAAITDAAQHLSVDRLEAIELNPVDALHGHLGVVAPHNPTLFLSIGGETEKPLQILLHLKHRGMAPIALVGRVKFSLPTSSCSCTTMCTCTMVFLRTAAAAAGAGGLRSDRSGGLPHASTRSTGLAGALGRGRHAADGDQPGGRLRRDQPLRSGPSPTGGVRPHAPGG